MITIDPPAVSVMFNVEEMVTVRDSISLSIENIPSSVSEVMNSGKIPVVLSVPASFAETMQADSLKAVLDLRNFRGGVEKILPRVEGLPPYSSVIRIDSVIVRL